MLKKCFINLLPIQRFSIHSPVYTNSFESKISLKNIYPSSSLDIFSVGQGQVSSSTGPFTGFIPIETLTISYCKSSGPGGQNVNKVNTKVDLRFHVESADWIPVEIRKKMSDKYQTSINTHGFLVVKSDRTRSQQLNLADAVDKLRWMIGSVTQITQPPSYKDLEIKRRRQEKSTRERLRQKRDRSLIKQERQCLDLE